MTVTTDQVDVGDGGDGVDRRPGREVVGLGSHAEAVADEDLGVDRRDAPGGVVPEDDVGQPVVIDEGGEHGLGGACQREVADVAPLTTWKPSRVCTSTEP